MQTNYHSGIYTTSKTILKIGGLFFPSKKDSYRIWLYATIQRVCFVINCQIWFGLTELTGIRVTYKHSNTLIEYLGRVILHVLTTVKVTNFIWKHKLIYRIMDTLESDEFTYEGLDDFQPAQIFEKTKRFVVKLNMACSFGITVVPSAYFGTSIMKYTRYYTAEEFLVGNVTCSEVLPYRSIPPFPTPTKVSCGFGIIYQLISILLYSWQFCGNDAVLATTLVAIQGHIDTNRRAFESIKPRAEARLRVHQKKKSEDKLDEDAVNEQMVKEIKKCTRHLETIIRVCDEAESVFSIVALGQTLNTLFTLVSCLFLLSNVSIVSSVFFAQAVYILGLLYQFTLYCWFGNEVMLASITIPDYMYHSDWVTANPTFKRIMLINMIRMKRPLVFTAAKFTTLTLTTLVTIVRGSYSYFAVLKNMEV